MIILKIKNIYYLIFLEIIMLQVVYFLLLCLAELLFPQVDFFLIYHLNQHFKIHHRLHSQYCYYHYQIIF